jgi:hypothetical protein
MTTETGANLHPALHPKLHPEELKAAEDLCLRVNRAGGMILLEAGRLRVVQPHGGLPRPCMPGAWPARAVPPLCSIRRAERRCRSAGHSRRWEAAGP